MDNILNAINEYKDLAIKCALNQGEISTALQAKQKYYTLEKIADLISMYGNDIRIKTLRDTLSIISNEPAND